jgi:hypothetical protein
MATKTLVLNDFTGAIGTLGEKRDVQGSARFLKGLNPFEDVSYVVNSKQPAKVSSTTVVNLPHWMEDGSPWTTTRYVYDEGGNIYSVSTSDLFTNIRTVSGSTGEGLKVFQNYLYYAGGITFGRYGKLDGSPTFSDDFLKTTLGIAYSTDAFDKDPGSSAGFNGTGNTYTTPVAISETATNRQTFTPTKEPIRAIQVKAVAKGTGNWTVTVHDEFNNVVGTSTITNASLIVGRNLFEFSPGLRVIRGNEYHFHVTSTVADGTVDTSVATDLEYCEFLIFFQILIDTDFHPIAVIEDTLIIGNERYLATWNEAVYDPNAITLDSGFVVRSIANFEEFIVAGANKGSSLEETEASRIFYWDGLAPGYNNWTEVPVGSVNALHNTRNNLIGVYGNKGDVYVGAEPFNKVIDGVPKLSDGKIIQVYPGGMTEHEGKTLIAYAASTDDTTGVELGVYQFGSQSSKKIDAFNFPYRISTGNTQATNLKISMVKAIGQDLYIGWREGTSYGVDKLTINSNYTSSGLWESLIFDNGNPEEEKLPFDIRLTFETLTTGQTVLPKYKLNRGSWVIGSIVGGTGAGSGATEVKLPIFNRAKEVEIGFNYTSSSNTRLKVTGVTFKYEDLSAEED